MIFKLEKVVSYGVINIKILILKHCLQSKLKRSLQRCNLLKISKKSEGFYKSLKKILCKFSTYILIFYDVRYIKLLIIKYEFMYSVI